MGVWGSNVEGIRVEGLRVPGLGQQPCCYYNYECYSDYINNY